MNSSETLLLKQRDEELSNMIYEGQIDDFISTLFQIQKPFTKLLKQLIKSFESEYLIKIKDYSDVDKSKTITEVYKLSLINRDLFTKNFTNNITSQHLKTLTKLASMETKLKDRHTINNHLLSIASLNPTNPSAKIIIKEFLNDCPEVVANACEEDISIKTNTASIGKPQVTGIYNSPQEEKLDSALMARFKNMRTIPNAPLSNIIDINSIKSRLNKKQQLYFFQTSIDNVVYEGNIPKYFFEIDSSFHDNDHVKAKDKDKDFFCEVSDIKLTRIRPEDPNKTSIGDFTRIVQTLMNKHI